MRSRKSRARSVGAATIGVAAVVATMVLGAGSAFAGTAPPDPAFEVAPHFYNGTVNAVRNAGSDTTYFLMQQVANLYNSAALYGCSLNSATGQGLFNDANNGVAPYPSTKEESFCQGQNLAVGNLTATSGSAVVTVTGGGNFQALLAAGQSVSSLAPAGLFPGGTTISSTSGSPITSITLSNNATASTTTGVLSFATGHSANIDTTDTADNWSLTEVAVGADAIGSGAGQKQLCGNLPSPLPVDFARSSKPIISTGSGGCTTEAELGFAKDGVPIVDFPLANPSAFGTSTFNDATTGVDYKDVNGGVIGPVGNGWLPGDPVGGPYNGTKLTNISNNDNGGSTSSTAYRVWCQSGAGRITDWGALTNLGPNLEVVNVTVTSGSATVTDNTGNFPASIAAGQTVSGPGIPAGTTVVSVSTNTATLSNNATASNGAATLTFSIASALAVGNGVPIGLPVRVVGINSSSGTEATFASFANSGTANPGCSSNMNTNAANDPNSATAPSPNSAHITLENNASQIGSFASGDFPGDSVDQAVEVATSLYIESNGVVNTNPHAGTVSVGGSNFSANKLNENGKNWTTPNLLQNFNPTARTLFNIYRTDTIRASAAGFLNWMCDSNTGFAKGTDNTTGVNFDTELSSLINTQFGFIRLTDTSSPPSNGGTPGDNLPAPNTTCAPSVIGVVITSGSTTLTLSGSAYPPSFPASFAVSDAIEGDGIPAGTPITANGGSSLTLSLPATATTSSGTVTVPGQPAITSVPAANLNS